MMFLLRLIVHGTIAFSLLGAAPLAAILLLFSILTIGNLKLANRR